MFQLYKKRNFNALINDTFTFLKASGKNYFTNYLLVNGGMLLVLLVLLFVVGRVFFENIFNGLGSPEAQSMLTNYFNANAGLFITGGFIALILVLLLSLLNFSFPVIYLGLLEHQENPTAQIIFARLKSKAFKIILFALANLITFIPIAIVVGIVSVLLVITIIGIPVAIGLWSALICWVLLSFYDYLNSNNGYFTAMKNGFNMLFKSFWPHMGTTSVFWIILVALQLFTSIITSLISSVLFYVDDAIDFEGNAVVTVTIFIISIAINYFFSNIFMLAHGMIYYSCKEQQENKSLYTEIDLIGTDSE